MSGSHLKRNPNIIILGFSTPNWWNPVSWLVRKVTRSRVSHVWVSYYDPVMNIPVVAEAHEFGFRVVRYDKFIQKNNVEAVFKLAYSPEQIMTKMSEWLGSMYDFASLFGMFLYSVTRHLGRKAWRNPFDSADAVFCSESVVRVLKHLDPTKYAELDENNTSPQDLLDYMAMHGVAQLPPS